MTPQERDLLTNLVSRLRQAPSQQTDPEAEGMINDLVADKPDTPYVLAQTVLIQDYALHQAQDRIADLEQQLQGQPARKQAKRPTAGKKTYVPAVKEVDWRTTDWRKDSWRYEGDETFLIKRYSGESAAGAKK